METNDKIEYIKSWLIDQLEKTPCEGLVIGVSGGIDSAVVSTLCAMTKKPTILVNMPNQLSFHTSFSFLAAKEHMRKLKHEYNNVFVSIVPINSIVEGFAGAFVNEERKYIQGDREFLAYANTQARIRMMVLYQIATMKNYLVVGTGNKVEDFGVGFYTKYGDGGVDISPIADLYKSEVYEIARELGVSQEILNATPTDGLWDDNRSDEQQLGATYNELEWVMKHCPEIIKFGYNPSRTWKDMTERQYEVMRKFIEHRNRNLHKMKSIPVCVLPKSDSEI